MAAEDSAGPNRSAVQDGPTPTQRGVAFRGRRGAGVWSASESLFALTTWDLVAWNRAASAFFAYDALALEQRNILRRIFFDPQLRALLRSASRAPKG
jgi:MmyB-like transcription regulator ligand binding domain